jgi:hypothetical protein
MAPTAHAARNVLKLELALLRRERTASVETARIMPRGDAAWGLRAHRNCSFLCRGLYL